MVREEVERELLLLLMMLRLVLALVPSASDRERNVNEATRETASVFHSIRSPLALTRTLFSLMIRRRNDIWRGSSIVHEMSRLLVTAVVAVMMLLVLLTPSSLASSGAVDPTTDTTIVTAYFQLSKHKHDPSEYEEWWAHHAVLKQAMVIYCEEPMCSHYLSLRQAAGLESLTHVIHETLNDTSMARNYPASVWEYQHSIDRETGWPHADLRVYWIWNEKSRWLQTAAERNPFNSSYFFWLDIGGVRDGSSDLLDGPALVRPEVTAALPRHSVILMMMYPFVDEELEVDAHTMASRSTFVNVDRIAGTSFGGTRDAVIAWSSAFYTVLARLLRTGVFAGKDQNVMAMTCVESPQLCYFIKPRKTSRYSGNVWWFFTRFLHGLIDRHADSKVFYGTLDIRVRKDMVPYVEPPLPAPRFPYGTWITVLLVAGLVVVWLLRRRAGQRTTTRPSSSAPPQV